MPTKNHALPTLIIALNADAPEELQQLATNYWAMSDVDARTGDVKFQNTTDILNFRAWSGTVHFAAGAGGTATLEGAACASCGEPLTLTSRKGLNDALRGDLVRCRACDGSVNARVPKILDPAAIAQRRAKAEADAARRAQLIAEQELRQRRLANAGALEQRRRDAIADRYAEPVDDVELQDANVVDRITTLALIHAYESPDGLLRHDSATTLLAPDEHNAVQLTFYAGLICVHPASPTAAFVWADEDSADLTDNLYLLRAAFTVPGAGRLTERLATFATRLRNSLTIDSMWSTDRAEIANLAERLIAGETERYFRYKLDEHRFLNALTDQHRERLRTLAHTASRHFALGHIYNMLYMCARDVASVHDRHAGMSREKAISHGLNRFDHWIQRAVDSTDSLKYYNEHTNVLPLTELTGLLFRTVLGVDPMRSDSAAIREQLADAPDAELRDRCDEGIPERPQQIEWLRTSLGPWNIDDFRSSLALLRDWTPDLCAPHCAHENVAAVAAESGLLYDRIVARTGALDAAIVTAEATRIGNVNSDGVRTGDAVLGELVRLLQATTVDA